MPSGESAPLMPQAWRAPVQVPAGVAVAGRLQWSNSMSDRKRWYGGVDWGSESHDGRVIDEQGHDVGEKIFKHAGEGLAEMAAWLLATSGGAEPGQIDVAIEVPHGPVVETLIERGFAVWVLNPKQMDRFRDRYSMAGAKDDSRDSLVMPSALRTDPHCFRRLAATRVTEPHARCVLAGPAGTPGPARPPMVPLVARLQLINRQLAQAHHQLDTLTAKLGAAEETEPGQIKQRDADILASLPGIGRIVLATLLAEATYALQRRDYFAFRRLASVAPFTWRSGNSCSVWRPYACHPRA